MKKIAFVLETLDMGGVSKSLITLLKLIDWSMYEVTLYLANNDGEMHQLVDPRTKIKNWNCSNDSNYLDFLKKMIPQHKWRAFMRSLYYRGLAHTFLNNTQLNTKYTLKSSLYDLDTEKYDIAIAYQGFSSKVLLFTRYAVKAKKYVCWIHGSFQMLDVNTRTLFSEQYSLYDSFVCVSDSVKDLFLAYLPQYKKMTNVIYNIFDFDAIRKNANEPIDEKVDGVSLVTVGRLIPVKGQRMIPSIAKKLLELGYNFTWFVIGDGPDKEIIQKEIKELSLEKNVILTGAKNNPYPYMKMCDIYIQPSLTEGFCLTSFEARILNKRIVVTNVPGMSEQFTEGEAFFSDANVPALARTIQKALTTIHQPVEYIVNNDFNSNQLLKFYQLIN